MSARDLAAIAAKVVGRRVRLTRGGYTGTVTRVTGSGMVVKLEGVTASDIAEWID